MRLIYAFKMVGPAIEQRSKRKRSTKKKRGKFKAVFDVVRDQFLIDLCIEHNPLLNTMSAASKKQAWTTVIEKFNQRFGTKYTKEQFRDHMVIMKKIYNFLKEIQTFSGFCWDPGRQKVIATEAVWDDYIKLHPNKKKYMDKTFPSFDSMACLFEDTEQTQADERMSIPISPVWIEENLNELSDMAEPASEQQKCGQSTKEKESKVKATYDLRRDQFLIDMCLEYNPLSNAKSAASKKQAWKKVMEKFNVRFGTSYRKGQFQDHMLVLRKIYNFLKEIQALDGFHWDSVNQKVIASEEAWEDYVERHPDRKKYMDKKFPSFESMAHLFEEQTQAGERSSADHTTSQPNMGLQKSHVGDRPSTVTPLDWIGESSDEFLLSVEPHKQEYSRGKRGINAQQDTGRKKRYSVDDWMASEIHGLNEIRKQLFVGEREAPPTLFEKVTKLVMSMSELSTEQKVEAVCLIKGDREAEIFNAMTPDCRLAFLKRLGLNMGT